MVTHTNRHRQNPKKSQHPGKRYKDLSKAEKMVGTETQEKELRRKRAEAKRNNARSKPDPWKVKL